jgi:RNA polymerase sigma-70 factor (ECF subfamily)
MEDLARRFDEHRGRLRAVAQRMLGSASEADDAVQEAWLRLQRSGSDEIENLRAWLTTVVARVCLDHLRARKARREEPLGMEALTAPSSTAGPEDEALLADAVGPALLVVLETLEPAERLAYVLHDLFAVSFAEIARVVGRSEVATRQLASRARRRVQGGTVAGGAGGADRDRQRGLVAAFLAASREGNFGALLALLDPDVVLRADAAAVASGAKHETLGAQAVAETFKGRALAARLAHIDGTAGAVWMAGGQVRVAFEFTAVDGRIVAIDLLADPTCLAELELEVIESSAPEAPREGA